jgi:hypothetical protein
MNRRLLILSSAVVGVHLFFFFFNFKKDSTPPPLKSSIVVRTFIPPPPPKKTSPVIKQRKKQSSTRSSSTPTKASLSPNPKTNKKKNDLLKELRESLKRLETQPPVESFQSLTPPKNIRNLEIDHVEKEVATDYFLILAQTLKNELELPEYGDVKLELTILNNGRITKLRVMNASSDKNKRYLELKLPNLVLPPFSEDLKNQCEHTFTLTFCNET